MPIFSNFIFSSICLVLIGVINSISSFAQRSYDFALPLPPLGKQVKCVSKSYFGTYSCGQTDLDYEFNENGVFVIALVFSSISREAIRESSKYRVSNGWLHGVKENDSIPCELQGEYYHFALKRKEQIASNDSSGNILVAISDRTYILNFEENGHFFPSIFEFKGSELHVRHFTYEEGTSAFDMISEQLERRDGGMFNVTLRPTKEEWDKLPIEAITGNRLIFLKTD